MHAARKTNKQQRKYFFLLLKTARASINLGAQSSRSSLSSICRRKPQNLTPPLSSDGGSSTSGQSPNSQHNGSPPPAVKRPSSQAPSSLNNNINSSNLINDKYLEPAAKKPRISHYKKPDAMDGVRSSGLYDTRDAGGFMNSRSRDNDDYYG